MTWKEADIKRLQNKGFKVDLPIIRTRKNSNKGSKEKSNITFVLMDLKQQGLIDNFVQELKFHPKRKFRFDWAIPSLKIAIEYEGVISSKSRHTTISGYTKDCEKYNLATSLGWKILRYTAVNYKDLDRDLKALKLIKS